MKKYRIIYELTAVLELEANSDSEEDRDEMMERAFYMLPGVEINIQDVLVEEIK